ncbi:hypothetical protein HZB60_01850 [candidate division KSB1 bacterium]|nr:hypothetical protein [candidate division KSB1 bacterium]
MRFQTPFVWLAILFAACFGLLTGPAAYAQFNIIDGPDIVCIDNGGAPDTIDAPEDSIRITVTMTGEAAYGDILQLIFNPSPGLGLLPVSPQTFDCPTGPITGYPMTITSTVNDPPGFITFTGEIVIRPEGICIAADSLITFDIAARGTDTSPNPDIVQCGQFTRTQTPQCNICIPCGLVFFTEVCGIWNDGIIAIGDSVWLDSTAASAFELNDNDTVFADFSNFTCDGADAITFIKDTIEVVDCAALENGVGCDTVYVIHATWDPGDSFGDPSTVYDTVGVCLRAADNLRPELEDCLDSMVVINGNYLENDTLAGCYDTIRFYFSPYVGGSCYDLFGGVDLACGEHVDDNFDVTYVAIQFADWVSDLIAADPDYLYQHNNDPVFVHCIETPDGVDSTWWIGDAFTDGTGIIWADLIVSSQFWDSLQRCLDNTTAGAIHFQFIDDAGNSDNVGVDLDIFSNYADNFCADNVPPDTLGNEIYFDDSFAACATKRFSPYDSLDASYYTNLSPDSARWYLPQIDESWGTDPDEWDDLFNDVYLVGFDIRQEPDENPEGPTGAIISYLDWIAPGAPAPMDDDIDTIAWVWRDPAEGCFMWWGKNGTDSLDALLSLVSPCPYGAIVGITHARYMDAAGCNTVLGSDHDGMTDLSEGYTTLNQLHCVIDTCKPTFAGPLDGLHFNPALPAGPNYGPDATCVWNGPNGVADDPIIEFRARRWFTQGLSDTCQREWLYYRVRVDTVFLQCTPGQAWLPGDSTLWYTEDDPDQGLTSAPLEPVPFQQNSFIADTVNFTWGHENSVGDPLPDGLYLVTLELVDNAGNVQRDPKYFWLNGVGPCIDSLIVTGDGPPQPTAPDCKVDYYVNDLLCVWMRTDTTADSVLFDFSCIYQMEDSLPDGDSVWVTSWIDEGDERVWEACITVEDWMIDTAGAYGNNQYIVGYNLEFFSGVCGNFFGSHFIGASVFDDGLVSYPETLTDPDLGPCVVAVLGLTPCPRIVPISQWFFYYDPDSVQAPTGPASYVDPAFIPFDTMPDWNAFSPGSMDSMGLGGSYDAILNPANDEIQDSLFVRLLIDLSTIDPDTTDTLVLQFYNPTNDRLREVRKALFVPTSESLTPDPNINNTIYDGFLELDDALPAYFAEFRYYWNGTWYQDAGVDSLMLVHRTLQDTIIVRAYTIAGDSVVSADPDTTYLICDTVSTELDVDNENPFFIGDGWSGIADNHRDWYTGTTRTVLNLGVDGDCGRRYEDGEPFSLMVKLSERVHYDAAAYPNNDGSTYPWDVTRNWQISAVNTVTGALISGVDVWLNSVEDSIVNSDSVYYTLSGYFDLPDVWDSQEVCLVIRSAWDQAGNPGRYNDPVFTDAYENDATEDTSYCVFLIDCNPWTGCPDVWGRPDGVGTPDSVLGWIAAEEDSIVVCATIVETCELALCPPGSLGAAPVDSIHVIEGNFQTITDDPNPWVIADAHGEWFKYVNPENPLDTIGWARNWYWYLRADSADLATIHCDGDYLPFGLHFTTYGGKDETADFEECVQVDVNEPQWFAYSFVADTAGGMLALMYDEHLELANYPWGAPPIPTLTCVNPAQPYTFIGFLTDDGIDCEDGDGVGLDTAAVWADFTNVYMDADSDSVRADSVVLADPGLWLAYWTIWNTNDAYDCLVDTFAIVRYHALHDSLGHHDRELFWQDTLYYCSDCLPPDFSPAVFCDCDSMFEILDDVEESGDCPVIGLQYVHPGGDINVFACVHDPDTDSSFGLTDNTSSYAVDLSQFDPGLGWVTADQISLLMTPEFLGGPVDTQAVAIWGGGNCDDQFSSYMLTNTYENGDTIYARFWICDGWGNCTDTTIWYPVAIVDTLRPIIDFVYTIGDDSVRAYVTPGDDHVNIYADINGYAADLISSPLGIWADFSDFWCDDDSAEYYDTVYADYVDQIDENHFRAYWGWYPGVGYADPNDTTTYLSNHYSVDPEICACSNVGAEGTYGTLYFYVGDAACNVGSAFSIFEFSGCDSTVPDVDSVWVMDVGQDCAPNWFRGQIGDTIEVWAWLDSLFNGIEDTLRIDSMMADLRQFGASYDWTAITTQPDHYGGAPAYGVEPDWTQDVPAYWDIEVDCEGRDRLVAKWIIVNEVAYDCGVVVEIPVKSQRQTGQNGSHGYYLDMTYGSAESFTATYVWSWVRGDYTWVTGFPGNPDEDNVDSVVVLQRGVYNIDFDSLMTVSVVMDPGCLVHPESEEVYDWSDVHIDFTGFLTTDPWQYPDEIFYNFDENGHDSLVFYVPLYDESGGGAEFNTSIASNRYWFPLVLSDVVDCGEGTFWEQYCLWEDLDSVISFTIQNYNEPNPGMILLCDSTTAGCDTNITDAYNMALWNQENTYWGISSPDTEYENLYKIYYAPGNWAWFSHSDDTDDPTRFFIFVEDSVLQCDGIDNDNDGFLDELGEGVDFYTADLRINTMPQVAHIDSMNVEGVWINYLWYADNFSERVYNVDLFISDIYGHRDTLACGDYALTFLEDETCPVFSELTLWLDGEPTLIRVDQTNVSTLDLEELTADDSLFVFANFDSVQLSIYDPALFDGMGAPGSGVDVDPSDAVDSLTYNGTGASTIELLDPSDNVIAGFGQTFYTDSDIFSDALLTLSDPTGTVMDGLPDGVYTVRITTLDRVGNSCNFSWQFTLDRTCPEIVDVYTARPGTLDATDDLFASWDYVEIRSHIVDQLDGVDSVIFDYCFDANRDNNVDAYPFWQTTNILGDEGGNWDTEYPFVVYWNIRNLPWNSEDTLGLPPVRPDSCMNRYFVRIRAWDIYGHECADTIPVDITDDIAPLAGMASLVYGGAEFGEDQIQGALIPCFNPNTMTDSTVFLLADDYIDLDLGYDPLPGDSFTIATNWFDLFEGMFQFKQFEAPNIYFTGNTDPNAGWVVIPSGTHGDGQDTITYRHFFFEDFAANWNIVGLPSDQYNLRFLSFDVCGNVDPLNTPVVTVRIECDTTAPLAVICWPTPDLCLTNYRCDSTGTDAWVPVKSSSPIFSDVDSVAFFFVDSLSVPGQGIHTFIGGNTEPDSVVDGFAFYFGTRWNTNNLLSGTYWLYAVAYDNGGLFDTDPIWQPVFVDNEMPRVTECWVADPDVPDEFEILFTTWEDSTFVLRANASDNGCGITGVQFQYLDRFGNWRNLVEDNDVAELYYVDMAVSPIDGFDEVPDAAGYYEVWVSFHDFGNSPLDSIRFRAYAIDDVDYGNDNVQGDYNRDCNLDRDLECGSEICCMALEIRDRIPFGTNVTCWNHGVFAWALPQFAESFLLTDGQILSTCDNSSPLDTLLMTATVHDSVEDGWLMHFKYRRSGPEGYETAWDYIPNDQSLNPAIPALGPIALINTWDSVYVVWSGVRGFIEAADEAAGLWYSTWEFTAYVTDLTGNAEASAAQNTCELNFACMPKAPITAVSYVQNSVEDPEVRVRVTEPVSWQDAEVDTIEIIYNRTTDPNDNDPDALVLFYTDADAIRNCRGDTIQAFNIQLWNQDTGELVTTQQICWPAGDFRTVDQLDNDLGWDQYPPDGDNGNQYQIAVYFNNSYLPGVYNFAMIVRTDPLYFAEDGLFESDSDFDGDLYEELSCIDLVVRVANVNEPQMVFCTPDYGDLCVHGTVPLSAHQALLPPVFTGVVDTVWFQRFDGTTWQPVVDAISGLSYDADPTSSAFRFQIDEHEVQGMAGWYYDMANSNNDPVYDWYAERDLIPDVALWLADTDEFHPMTRDDATGIWTVDVTLNTEGDPSCYGYAFVIDANDNNIWEGPNVDRWVDDPRDACAEPLFVQYGEGGVPVSQVCACNYMVNFDTRTVLDGSYNYGTIVRWHDDVAYHVIEDPSEGDSVHVFFINNTIVEDGSIPAVHDIEFDRFYLNGGLCDTADVAHFVTDIQTNNGGLVVEDICMVIYQVSLTSNPFADSSWANVDTVWSNDDQGWIEAWPGSWAAYNPIADNIDNDGDGLVDETYDVQAGDGVGEENTLFWSRSVVIDECGNTYVTNAEQLWVDVSEPQACITTINNVDNPDNTAIMIPADRLITITATDQSYADHGVLGWFQYRSLNPNDPEYMTWTSIQPAAGSDTLIRHDGLTYTGVWDLEAYFNHVEPNPDPESWFQLRVVAIDTVNNTDLCDNVVCQITVRFNDSEPASRIEVYQIWNAIDTAYSCTEPEICYIQPDAPYWINAIFAATNIDTGLASLTFQYQSLIPGGEPSEWRNLETIYDDLTWGSDGDTTVAVEFQPRPDEIGDHGFNIRVIVEDYNGNDTSVVKTLYVDGTAPIGESEATPTVLHNTYCGDRCRLDNENGIVTITFDPDDVSGEVNVNQVWLYVERDDELFSHNFGELTNDDVDTWTFDFGGDLCTAWLAANLDMGCYHMWVSFSDCAGNIDTVAVTTDCGFGVTDLVCIDCTPELPDHSTLDYMEYEGWDCTENETVELTDNVLDGTTEVGNQTVSICGALPEYQQYVWGVQLWGQLGDDEPVLIDSIYWTDSRDTHGNGYCFDWDVSDYENGHWHLWVLAIDAICDQQADTMADNFWVYVDNATPLGTITQLNGAAPNPVAPDTLELLSGENEPAWLWVEWTDGLNPDDSTQAHNRVQLYCKDAWHPNQADSWLLCGEIPSDCNPHYILLELTTRCNQTLDIVAVVSDRWGNGDLSVEEAMEAYTAGRYIDVYIQDTTPPAVQLWALNWDDTPDCDEEAFTVFDQQAHSANWTAAWGHDVWLHAFGAQGDYTIERVYFEYSLDGTTWFEIGMDDNADWPASWNCEECSEPLPWWCGAENNPDILWTAYWDVAGLTGDVRVRVRGEDRCGNIEEWENYTVSFDVEAPIAEVFVWESDVTVDDLPCDQWTEPQIPDTLERYTLLTLGACPEQENYDAYGVYWLIKRADDHPLNLFSWCYLGDDSTGPFSARYVDLWNGDCPNVEVGSWYDIAALTTDQSGNQLTLTQLLNHGNGTTYEEKWADLISRGYVKRFRVTDHTAPIAYSLTVTPDQTPDSSVVFVTGNVNLQALLDARDVEAVTWATLEQGMPGPWTIIERIAAESDTQSVFSPVEGTWNTELLNGTYWIGAFAEDFYGNIDGNTSLGEAGAPTNPLIVNVDNQPPTAVITQVTRDDVVVTNLERGAVHTFALNAADNFGLRQVALYYRHSGGDPDAWTLIGTDTNFPYSFNWQVPTDLVDGWTYDFAAVATDLVYQTDFMDAQGQYIIDGSYQVVDNEANIAIFTIGGVDAETNPHLNGTNIAIVAHSEPYLDNVRFVWVRGVDTTDIRTVPGPIGTTTWTVPDWDVTTISEGPAQLGAIGSADVGGELVTRGYDFRNIVIDHSVPAAINGNLPVTRGLVGGACELDGSSEWYDDVWVTFNLGQTDANVDSVWFEWKWAADNDTNRWTNLGLAVRDGVTGRWALASDFTSFSCGTISVRARISDNAVPLSNEAFILFADSVRVDNCAPIVDITNINGDVTPAGTEIAQGQVATISATATDPFSNGGVSQVDSVCFYFVPEDDGEYQFETWQRLGCDNSAPYQVSWNTGGVPFGEYIVYAVGYDHAGNCTVEAVNIFIIDQLYQRAWIVGFDVDNGLGCLDKIWAVTDDCPPNWTSSVVFQYSTDNGQSWVALGEDNDGTEYCDEWLDYHIWEISAEFDAIPANAAFRAVAYDESGTVDPAPPRFLFSDVSTSPTPVLYTENWVNVPVQEGQVPWVFATLEDYTESCITDGGLVCVEQTEGDPTHYAGPLPSIVHPCRLNNRDGQVTVFRTVTTVRSGNTFVLVTKYEMNVHRVDQEGGSNGWLTSEDLQLRMIVPDNGITGHGAVWFQPSHDNDNVNLLPPSQYYYTLLSEVETVFSNDLGNGTDESRFSMRFNAALLPQGYVTNQIIAAYWDEEAQIWVERGIVYENRNVPQGTIDFHWIVDWNVSISNECPDGATLAIFYSNVAPLSGQVFFRDDDNCWQNPDSTYYTPARGVTVDCDPVFWAVLRQGEYVPLQSTIDVWLDGIRIVNDGQPSGPYENVWTTSYESVSGIFTVQFASGSESIPPYFGCLAPGQHHVQFWTDNLSIPVTPFWVDVTGPEAWMNPTYINHQTTLVALLTDGESGIDTAFTYLDLMNCEDYDYTYEVTAEALTWQRIEGGYQVSIQLQWDQIVALFPADEWGSCLNPPRLCAHWHIYNDVCGYNDETHDYAFTIDVEPPQVRAVSPIGDPIDNDGDGLTNEDWRDCVNNDNDFWWNNDWDRWEPRYDEDPIDFETDTMNCGQRSPIQAAINDLVMCCSGASQVDIRSIALFIDGVRFGIADTANAQLNFRVYQRYNQDDAFITFGGPTSGAAADFAYIPGPHNIAVVVADSAGNAAGDNFAWEYYVRCAGPAITFAQQECGNWWNPEGQNEFAFWVQENGAGANIAPNGIRYRAYTLPDSVTTWPWTTIDPNGRDSVYVSYDPSGSFPDDQTALVIEVEATDINFVQGDDNGRTFSSWTFTVDNCAPTLTAVTPTDGQGFTRDQAIVVEVLFTDDCNEDTITVRNGGNNPAVINTGKQLSTGTVKIGRMGADGSITNLTTGHLADMISGLDSRGGHGTLDDNGSGIILETFDLNIFNPLGENVGPESTGDYAELDDAHAKYIVAPGGRCGEYTVNARITDCVGNIGTITWTFVIECGGPSITFNEVEGDCRYQNYWNPSSNLPLSVTLGELDDVNLSSDGIRIDVVRLYNCDGGLCTDTILTHANFTMTPAADPNNTDQVFTVTGNYNLDDDIAAVELRVVVSATNSLGATTTSVQSWIVDGTGPAITIVTPEDGQVLPSGQAITISADYTDIEPALAALLPGGNVGTIAPAIDVVGPTRLTKSAPKLFGGAADTKHTNQVNLGSWTPAIAGHGTLDGMSGVDVQCVELLLRPGDGSAVRRLHQETERVIITDHNITWVGPLPEGSYTLILSVCDRVCNTSFVTWSFAVSPNEAGVEYLPPFYLSSMPHEFAMRVAGNNVDYPSAQLMVEAMTCGAGATWTELTDNGALRREGNMYYHDGNYDLGRYCSFRLTLRVNYTYGVPVPGGSQIYTVDTAGPRFTGITPEPYTPQNHNVLQIGSTPTFIVNFEEVGNTTLDGESFIMSLRTMGGVTVATDTVANIDAAGTSGWADLTAGPLAAGEYDLYATVADVAGNATAMTWHYVVGERNQTLTEGPVYNYPNPFTPADGHTTFVFPVTGVEGNAEVQVKLYDWAGNFVATIYDGPWSANCATCAVTWAGTNDGGDQVANGVYLANVKITASGKTRQEVVKVAFKNEK